MMTKRFPDVRVLNFRPATMTGGMGGFALVEFDGFKGPVSVDLNLLSVPTSEINDHTIDVQDDVLVLGGRPLAFLEHTIESDRLAAELAASDDKRIANAAKLGTLWRSMNGGSIAFKFTDAAAIYGLAFEMNKNGTSVKSATLNGKKLPKAEAVSLFAAFQKADARLNFFEGRLSPSVQVNGLPGKLETELRNAINSRLAA